ncbi:hypothetical protein Taro_028224 [Colocasia esculenta]|uniref:Pentatricopeptide repeat-containing protein n=1 Tax=Colocasia esculenta TaxID=4460 RepID=A0A843VGP4_COLES|nr:hypothetical protein [Colocasia esculenta]
MLLLPPPHLATTTAFLARLPSLRHALPQPHHSPPPISAIAATSLPPDPVLPLEARRHDFGPLLHYLSSNPPSPSSSSSSPPTHLDPSELRLAESYRAVPAHHWHALLKSLAASSSTLPAAAALVPWLQRHRLCYAVDLLYSILIHALGRAGRLSEAFQLSHQAPLSAVTYNAMISACARSGDLEKALGLLAQMRRNGFQSDYVNYSLIVQTLTRSGDAPNAAFLEKIYSEIVSEKIELDSKLLNDLVVAFSRSGDPDRALFLLGVIQGQGLSPKSATLVALISALGGSGRVAEAEAVFEELKDGGLMPRARAYNALLKGYVKAGSLKDAEYVFAEMEKNGVTPDERTYSLLIDAYTNAGRWESGRILLKEMEANDVRPNSYVFSRMLAILRDKGDWQKSFSVLKEMKSNGVRPDRHFYNVMIDMFGKYNCLQHAMDAFQRMRLDGIEPDTVTWNTLIDAHCKAGWHDKAMELFEEMQETGCMPCTTTYNIMINSLGEQERWEEVEDLLAKMRGQGLIPNSVTYTTLVDVYGKSGRFRDAIECLEVLKAGGLKPSQTMYHALVNAYAQRSMVLKWIPSSLRKLLEMGVLILDIGMDLLSLDGSQKQLLEVFTSLSSPKSWKSSLLGAAAALHALDYGHLLGSLELLSLLSQLQGLSLRQSQAVTGMGTAPFLSPARIQMHQNTSHQLLSGCSSSKLPSSSSLRASSGSFFGIDHSLAAVIMNSQSFAFAKRSQSFIDRGAMSHLSGLSTMNTVAARVDLSSWGSLNCKLDRGIQGEERKKLRKSASFGIQHAGSHGRQHGGT